MRKRFVLQHELGRTSIEEIIIPTKSRDELPPVLMALQYIFVTEELSEQVFALLEERIEPIILGERQQTLVTPKQIRFQEVLQYLLVVFIKIT